jgi:HSP20 family protein
MEWDIFDEMQRMQKEMERMFTASCTSCQGPGCIPQDRPGSVPQNPQIIPEKREVVVDVQQTDTSVIVTAEVVGMERDDIDLTVTPEKVEIGAKKDSQRPGERFHTVVPLPSPVKCEGATATCKNGVLEITLPKDKAATKSQDIKIK